MKKFVRKFGGVILFYGVIVIMIILINYRFSYLNELNENTITYAYNN